MEKHLRIATLQNQNLFRKYFWQKNFFTTLNDILWYLQHFSTLLTLLAFFTFDILYSRSAVLLASLMQFFVCNFWHRRCSIESVYTEISIPTQTQTTLFGRKNCQLFPIFFGGITKVWEGDVLQINFVLLSTKLGSPMCVTRHICPDCKKVNYGRWVNVVIQTPLGANLDTVPGGWVGCVGVCSGQKEAFYCHQTWNSTLSQGSKRNWSHC